MALVWCTLMSSRWEASAAAAVCSVCRSHLHRSSRFLLQTHSSNAATLRHPHWQGWQLWQHGRVNSDSNCISLPAVWATVLALLHGMECMEDWSV